MIIGKAYYVDLQRLTRGMMIDILRVTVVTLRITVWLRSFMNSFPRSGLRLSGFCLAQIPGNCTCASYAG